MTTIPPLSEVLRNEVLASLDERAARLKADVERADAEITGWEDGRVWPRDYSEDFQRAYVWNVDALLQNRRARELIGEAEATPEQADDVTAAKAYADWQENEKAGAWGR